MKASPARTCVAASRVKNITSTSTKMRKCNDDDVDRSPLVRHDSYCSLIDIWLSAIAARRFSRRLHRVIDERRKPTHAAWREREFLRREPRELHRNVSTISSICYQKRLTDF